METAREEGGRPVKCVHKLYITTGAIMGLWCEVQSVTTVKGSTPSGDGDRVSVDHVTEEEESIFLETDAE